MKEQTRKILFGAAAVVVALALVLSLAGNFQGASLKATEDVEESVETAPTAETKTETLVVDTAPETEAAEAPAETEASEAKVETIIVEMGTAPEETEEQAEESEEAEETAEEASETEEAEEVEETETTEYEEEDVTICYVAAEGGSVSTGSETVKAKSGEAQGANAAAAEGYVFVNWTKSVNGEEQVVGTEAYFVPVKVDDEYVAATYTAHFAEAEEPACTCGAAEGEEHAEDCPLYEAPECTCGAAEGEKHAKDCPLYVAPERKAWITTSVDGQTSVVSGTPVTLYLNLEGYEDCDVTATWQHSVDNASWEDAGTGMEYTFPVDEENVSWYWHVVMTVVEPA